MPPSPSAQNFDPRGLYSSNSAALLTNSKNNNASFAAATPSQPSMAATATTSVAAGDTSERKKVSKRRKVNQACIYCRRSHMTCDDGRPCQRCLKRDIGHLCHDEATPSNQAAGEGSDTSTTSRAHVKSSSPAKSHLYTSPNDAASGATPVSATSLKMESTTELPTSDAAPSSSASAATPYFPTLGASFGSGQLGPYSSASPMSALNQNAVNNDALSAYGSSSMYKQPSASSQLYQTPLASATSGMSAANILSLASLFQNTINGNNPSASLVGNGGVGTNASASSTDTSGLGGAGWLGLGGGPTSGYDGEGSGFGGDIAGGNEFTLLSEFLESLDGPGYPVDGSGMTPGALNSNSRAVTPTTTTSRRNTITGVGKASDSTGTGIELANRASEPANPVITDNLVGNADSITAAFADSTGRGKRSRHSSLSAAAKGSSASASTGAYVPSLGEGSSSKTEKFFLTAADQKDGTRDERLARVIQAKYEAGLLRPYNHVNGYARLNRWMERNVSLASKRRILKPLSVFRPAFRAVAQGLTTIDLIFIEEAFERLLLDYDRVFSTQGIPACLWRRTGEIYKGNKEFADLIGVPIESLREGRLCIYELMAEESAVNYWEKYGAVSFDKGQKAVLTSCVLRTKNKIIVSGGNGGITGSGGGTGWGINRKDRTAANAISAQLPQSSGGSGQITPTNTGATPLRLEMSAITESANTASPSKKEAPALGTGATSTSGIVKDPNNPKAAFLHCCFSFTIRRDQWNIPTMIVGNFLPTNPP